MSPTIENKSMHSFLLMSLRSHMKHSFDVFDHALKIFKRDERLSVPCFQTLYQDQTLEPVFYISHEKLSSDL